MDVFSFVKSHVSIFDVVSEYTTLKRAGGTYLKGRCPFHQEKTASFTISPDKGIYYCFGCHETGDVIAFTAKAESVSQYEAVQLLVDKFNITLPEEIISSRNQRSPQEKKGYYDLCERVAIWCNTYLSEHKAAYAYVQSRHISPQTMHTYQIGYFPSRGAAFNKLLQELFSQGHTIKEAVQAGIVFQGRSGIYSPFENRIIFPIKDHLGRCCGFGGRIFVPQDERPKYYNSKENSYFQKGHLLFGLHISKKAIQQADACILVEGYTDCIALYEHGYTHTVATLGTACTIDHLQQIARYAQKVYVIYDGDHAGQKAILRLAELCWQVDLEIEIVNLPEGTDPASLFEQQPQYQELLAQTQDIFSFFVATTSTNFEQKSLKDKKASVATIMQMIKRISDTIKQDLLLLQASKSLQIPLDMLRQELAQKTTTSTQKKIVERKTSIEELILASLLHEPAMLTQENTMLLTHGLQAPYNRLFERITSFWHEHPDATYHNFLETLSEKQQQSIHTLLFKVDPQQVKQTFEQLILQFQKKHWKSIVVNIKMELRNTNNSKDIEIILKNFQNLKNKLLKDGRL